MRKSMFAVFAIGFLASTTDARAVADIAENVNASQSDSKLIARYKGNDSETMTAGFAARGRGSR